MRSLASDLISVYKALGGGWEAFEETTVPAKTGATAEPAAKR